jgi:hypothetical protein
MLPLHGPWHARISRWKEAWNSHDDEEDVEVLVSWRRGIIKIAPEFGGFVSNFRGGEKVLSFSYPLQRLAF